MSMNEREVLKLALGALEAHADIGIKSDYVITAIKEALAQPEQEPLDCIEYVPCCTDRSCPKCKAAAAQPQQAPVAMKFKIYKPTVPDPTRQDINNALLPWVYDQDRSSGFEASMWVTPVVTLSSQRKPLTDEEIYSITGVENRDEMMHRMARNIARAIEAAHGIQE